MSRPQALFVTGTDTGVGKTLVSLALMVRGRREGLTVLGLKPVASGCQRHTEGLVNADALRLSAESTVSLSYRRVNAYAFEPPIAPHLAAELAGRLIDLVGLTASVQDACRLAELIVVEGVGGWEVPLAGQQTLADLVRALDLPVVLVVGMRIGCLNHAILTAASILAHGCRLCGWVANTIDPAMLALEENVRTLKARLPAPLLGHLPYCVSASPDALAPYLSLPS